jgi:hypothetical protein
MRALSRVDEELRLMCARLAENTLEERKTALWIHIDRLLDERLEKKYTARHSRDNPGEKT